jgi:hypothetical protein
MGDEAGACAVGEAETICEWGVADCDGSLPAMGGAMHDWEEEFLKLRHGNAA